ncbi:hypothetical protein [Dialister invisus]
MSGDFLFVSDKGGFKENLVYGKTFLWETFMKIRILAVASLFPVIFICIIGKAKNLFLLKEKSYGKSTL